MKNEKLNKSIIKFFWLLLASSFLLNTLLADGEDNGDKDKTTIPDYKSKVPSDSLDDKSKEEMNKEKEKIKKLKKDELNKKKGELEKKGEKNLTENEKKELQNLKDAIEAADDRIKEIDKKLGWTTTTWVLVVLGVIVLLGGIGFAVYYFGFRKKEEDEE